MGNAKDAAEERRLRRKGDNAKVQAPRVELETAKGVTVGKYLGLFCCQRSSFKPVPGQASSVSRCAGTGHSFFLSLHSSDTRRTCVLWVLWVSRATLFV